MPTIAQLIGRVPLTTAPLPAPAPARTVYHAQSHAPIPPTAFYSRQHGVATGAFPEPSPAFTVQAMVRMRIEMESRGLPPHVIRAAICAEIRKRDAARLAALPPKGRTQLSPRKPRAPSQRKPRTPRVPKQLATAVRHGNLAERTDAALSGRLRPQIATDWLDFP